MSVAGRNTVLGLIAAAALVAALGGEARPAGLPAALRERMGLNLGTALVLSGRAVAIGSATELSATAAALGRRLPALTRVYALPGLREGAQGNAVRLVQARLDGLGDRLVLDGLFGPKTRAAVASFDRAHAITAVGSVTRATWMALLGTRTAAAGRSAWALAAAYDTSPASLAAWNVRVRGSSRWAEPLHGPLWVMPPDVRPSARVIGSGPPAASPKSAQAAVPDGHGGAAATVGTVGTGSGASAERATVMAVLVVSASTSTAQVEGLAAWLGGRSIAATVILPSRLAGGRGATAMVLEGEDLGVGLGPRTGPGALGRAAAWAEAATGERPVVAYAGAYPSASAAAAAGHSGLALVVGGIPAGPATRPTSGSVYVFSGSPGRIERQLSAFVRRARAAGERVAAVRTALRLVAAA